MSGCGWVILTAGGGGGVGAHCARDGGGGAGARAEDPRVVPHDLRGSHGGARHPRLEEREGKVRRRRCDVHH